MLLISHRGNIRGREPFGENNPSVITQVRDLGYDVEIDVWAQENGGKYSFALGHDFPEHEIEPQFLRDTHYWVHAKNLDALFALTHNYKFLGANVFWHENDKYALTTSGDIWTANLETALHSHPDKRVVVVSHTLEKAVLRQLRNFYYGICSDNVYQLRELGLDK